MRQKKTGFTLIETLVAAGIILSIVSIAFTLIQQSTEQSKMSDDRLRAVHLARDAIEYISHVQYENQINQDTPWFGGLDPCLDGESCKIRADHTNNINPSKMIRPCSGASCQYGDTKFDRYVKIERLETIQSEEGDIRKTPTIRITATVEWEDDKLEMQTIKKRWIRQQ